MEVSQRQRSLCCLRQLSPRLLAPLGVFSKGVLPSWGTWMLAAALPCMSESMQTASDSCSGPLFFPSH